MKNRPLPVVIVALILIVVGFVGFTYHLKDFFNHQEQAYEVILVQLLRILAIVCGILLLRAINFGRRLAIAWILIHILISALNSISEMIAHIVVLIIVSTLLFLPKSSFYFQDREKPQG